jgi:hypothetical protein
MMIISIRSLFIMIFSNKTRAGEARVERHHICKLILDAGVEVVLRKQARSA